MRLLPYLRLTLTTDLRPDEVATRLARMVAPNGPFRGAIEGSRFKLERDLGTLLGLPIHNAFRPVVLGQIVGPAPGAVVHLRLRLQLLSATFLGVWFGTLTLAIAGLALGVVHVVPTGGALIHQTGGAIVVTGALWLATYVLVSLAFWVEVARARRLLCDGLLPRESTTVDR